MRTVMVTTIAVRAAGLLGLLMLITVVVIRLDQFAENRFNYATRPSVLDMTWMFIRYRWLTPTGLLWAALMVLSVHMLLNGSPIVRLLLRGLHDGGCPHCGYDISAIKTGVCPECGRRIGRGRAGATPNETNV